MKLALACLFAVVLSACGGSATATAPTVTLDASVTTGATIATGDAASNGGSTSDDESESANTPTSAPIASPTTVAVASPVPVAAEEDDSVAAASSPQLLTSGGTDIVADGFISFATPSGNISCSMGVDTFCHISEKEWEIDRPADCQDDYGNVVFVEPSGSSFGCYTDLFWDTDAAPLAYGSTVTVRETKCSIEPTGVTCLNGDGQGFRIARSAVELF